jgi:hypothetical protein
VDRPAGLGADGAITHELVHLYQEEIEEILKNSSKPPYRNAILVGTMNELGLYAKLGDGHHLKPADGQLPD